MEVVPFDRANVT